MNDDVIRNAQLAQNLLDDELLKSVFEKIEEDLKQNWKSTKPKSQDEREQFYYELRALESIRTKLVTFVNDGIIKQRKG